MARTTADILREWHGELSAVPHVDHDYVCKRCLGPVTGYNQCAGCYKVFSHVDALALHDRVVPMTSVLSPSRWYTALVNYKGFQPDLRGIVASVAHHFMASRRQHIEAMLGGEATIITIVPSKRGASYDRQPLRTAMAAVETINHKLRHTLSYDALKPVPHLGFNPAAFPAGPTPVRNERVILIEDSWASGATAVSAGAALLDHGADAVAILPIARIVNESWWPEDHPYRVAMRKELEPDQPDWPR